MTIKRRPTATATMLLSRAARTTRASRSNNARHATESPKPSAEEIHRWVEEARREVASHLDCISAAVLLLLEIQRQPGRLARSFEDRLIDWIRAFCAIPTPLTQPSHACD